MVRQGGWPAVLNGSGESGRAPERGHDLVGRPAAPKRKRIFPRRHKWQFYTTTAGRRARRTLKAPEVVPVPRRRQTFGKRFVRFNAISVKPSPKTAPPSSPTPQPQWRPGCPAIVHFQPGHRPGRRRPARPAKYGVQRRLRVLLREVRRAADRRDMKRYGAARSRRYPPGATVTR